MTEKKWGMDDIPPVTVLGIGVTIGFIAAVLLEHFFDFIM